MSKKHLKKKVKKYRKISALSILLNLFLIITGLFAISFAIYFFNLDMKLTSKLEPFMLKHYEKVPRDQHL